MNLWCAMIHICWSMGFFFYFFIVPRNVSMSLADLSKRNIDLSVKMHCQEFSNSLTGMCLCWSFRMFIEIALWRLCTLCSEGVEHLISLRPLLHVS
jgi:hypothetical protein